MKNFLGRVEKGRTMLEKFIWCFFFQKNVKRRHLEGCPGSADEPHEIDGAENLDDQRLGEAAVFERQAHRQVALWGNGHQIPHWNAQVVVLQVPPA